MYGPEGRILNFNTAWCKVVQSQVSILKHANKIYNEHKNMFLLNTTYTKILIYIEKVKKMFGPGPTGPYGSYAYVYPINLHWPGVGVTNTNPIFSVLLFSTFSVIFKTNASYWISRLYLAGVAQLSCSDTCQIWMWFRESNRYFCKIENFAFVEISEQSFGNPHPRPVIVDIPIKETNLTSSSNGFRTKIMIKMKNNNIR